MSLSVGITLYLRASVLAGVTELKLGDYPDAILLRPLYKINHENIPEI
jgi:hypothetical protein